MTHTESLVLYSIVTAVGALMWIAFVTIEVEPDQPDTKKGARTTLLHYAATLLAPVWPLLLLGLIAMWIFNVVVYFVNLSRRALTPDPASDANAHEGSI